MKKLVVFLTVSVVLAVHLCASVVVAAESYEFDWANQFGSTSGDNAKDVAIDTSGNVYVCGNNSTSGFLSKYNSNGTWQWTNYIGSGTAGNAYSVATDSSGNIYICGKTNGSMDGQPYMGGSDAFVAKYDQNGSWHWTRMFGTSTDDVFQSINVDTSGDIYVSGYSVGDFLGFTNLGSYDAYLIKLAPDNTILWAKQVNSTSGMDTADGIAIDASNNVFVCGTANNSAFVCKYNSSSTMIWIQTIGAGTVAYAYDIATDNLDNILVCGLAVGSMDGQTFMGNTDAFISKYSNSDGSWFWTRLIGTSDNDRAYSVAADGLGNVFIGGNTRGNLYEANLGNDDTFWAKYDSNGNVGWTNQSGTSDLDLIYGIAANASGDIFTAGVTLGDFYDTSNGYGDAFVAKFVFADICDYVLAGDMNDDCKVDFNDFSVMAMNWLIDCDQTPGDPACIPK